MAAIPDTLLEAELFGASASAYTGADKKGRIGKLQLADGGTLFLDEIGDMPASLQAKLLRAAGQGVRATGCQPGAARRYPRHCRHLGPAGRKSGCRQFPCRPVLPAECADHPPAALREHLQDLPELAESLLEQLARHGHVTRRQISHAALQRLAAYDWPGNVRELRNILERASMLGQGNLLNDTDINALLVPNKRYSPRGRLSATNGQLRGTTAAPGAAAGQWPCAHCRAPAGHGTRHAVQETGGAGDCPWPVLNMV
jgi:DNA-binding NtrC family response regulator